MTERYYVGFLTYKWKSEKENDSGNKGKKKKEE